MQISFLLQQYTRSVIVCSVSVHTIWDGQVWIRICYPRLPRWYMYIQITTKSLSNWDFVVPLMHCNPSDLDPDLDYPKGTHPVLYMYMQFHFIRTWFKFYFPLSWGNGNVNVCCRDIEKKKKFKPRIKLSHNIHCNTVMYLRYINSWHILIKVSQVMQQRFAVPTN